MISFKSEIDITTLCGIYDIHTSINCRNHEYDLYEKLFAQLPREIKNHRKYFKSKKRGFGENAFHAMWAKIFAEYKPKEALEIGVYRGQTISLWRLLAKKLNYEITIHGISPLDSSGDEVSRYKKLDFKKDIIFNFNYFNLQAPTLHKGYSTDPHFSNVFGSKRWDLIYIDGSHDEEVVRQDLENAMHGLKVNGILVMDDSSLYTDFTATPTRFKGHPGPSKILSEISYEKFLPICSVGHNNVFKKQ